MQLITNALLVNEGKVVHGALLIEGERIKKIFHEPFPDLRKEVACYDAKKNWLLPGVIDDQVHFREPGLTHKGDIASESKAAVAGGTTSFMEMPNTNPQTTNKEELDKKFDRAAACSLANYSFYLGATNDNIDEIINVDVERACGIKVFMGSSTGNMLVDNEETLKNIFKNSPLLVATHCEDEATIQANISRYKTLYGDDPDIKYHPEIRSAEACYKSSAFAIELAEKYNGRLHILHLSTLREANLLSKGDLKNKRITGEVCVHHLWFSDADYSRCGNRIKWNPSIKTREDRDGLLEALLEGRIDVVATDHAPHLLSEKQGGCFSASSGGPLVQHALVAMVELYHQGLISIETIVQKMCHNPALLFQVKDRGYLREGYYADLVVVDKESPWLVKPDNILYKCGWSPFEDVRFTSRIKQTYVNGNLVYDEGEFLPAPYGKALQFDR